MSDRTAAKVRDQVSALCGGHSQLLRHGVVDWMSITFAGERHALKLRFAGTEAVAAGDRFLAALPEHEFAIPGYSVVTAKVPETEHDYSGEDEAMTVTAELLLLEDA